MTRTINIRTYADTAASLDLWREYVDPDMAFSDEEFEAMSTEERIAHQVATFGPEPTEAEINEDFGFDA
jgi:hypothetical protein